MPKVSEWCGQRGAEGEHCHGRLRPPQAVWRDLCVLPRLTRNRRKGGSATDVQTKWRAQQTASNPSGKSALLAAPRFYKKRNHRDGVAVAMTTCFCFVSRAAAGVTANASSETASYPRPQQNRRHLARVFCKALWVTYSRRHAQACQRQGLKPEGPRP